MGDFIGYNPSKIEDLANNKVKNIANNVGTKIINELRTGVITPISTCWYTQEGVEYFEGFKAAVKSSDKVIEDVFNAYIEGLQRAADNWRDNSKSKKSAKCNKLNGVVKLDLNVSAVKPDKSGNEGIDYTAALAVANSLGAVRSKIQSELDALAKTLDASQAFLGRGQADAVKNCFGKIQSEVAKIFKFLDEDTNGDSLKTSIKKAADKYGDVGSKTSDFFNNTQ